jgi:uncharacterized protein YjbI with pentapeptide repeats
MSLWKRLQAALPRLGIVGLIVAVIAIIVFIAFVGVAYYTGVFPDPDWTGFGPPKVNADWQEIAHFKTLWEWLDLLLVPLVLAIGGFFLNRSENREARKIEKDRIDETRKIEEKRAQDATLQAYLDQMTQLLLHEYLRTSQPDNEVRSVARARTLTVLGVLDGGRKATVLQFLYEADLIGAIKQEEGGVVRTIDAIVSLKGAHLEEVNLTVANLVGAHLEETFLKGASLYRANLKGAHLERAAPEMAIGPGANLDGAHLDGASLAGAILTGANLTGANLRGADLRGANLTNCQVTREQLAQAKSLKGAKLPFDMTSPPAPEVEVAAQEDQVKEHTAPAPEPTKK